MKEVYICAIEFLNAREFRNRVLIIPWKFELLLNISGPQIGTKVPQRFNYHKP